MNSYLAVVGRIALSIIFIIQGFRKTLDFETTWKYMDVNGIPMAPMVLILVVALELGGGIAILVGFNAKLFSVLLGLYLIPTSFIFHSNWADPEQLNHFIKNIALMGGLFILGYNGAGPRSLDAQKLW